MAGLSASIRVLLEKLRSVLQSDFADEHKKSASYLELIHLVLLSIGDLVTEPDEKQLEEPRLKVWLQKIEDVVYDADDLTDEILYHEARTKLDAESQNPTFLTRTFIPSFGKRYGKGLKSKIKHILEAIDDLNLEKGKFHFPIPRRYEESLLSNRLATTSLLNETEVVGRDEDKHRIVRLLLSGDAKLDGIAIVAMGGVERPPLPSLYTTLIK